MNNNYGLGMTGDQDLRNDMKYLKSCYIDYFIMQERKRHNTLAQLCRESTVDNAV